MVLPTRHLIRITGELHTILFHGRVRRGEGTDFQGAEILVRAHTGVIGSRRSKFIPKQRSDQQVNKD